MAEPDTDSALREEQYIDRPARDRHSARPAILARFSAEMRRPESDVRKQADLIATDIALFAALLKLVNSPVCAPKPPTRNRRARSPGCVPAPPRYQS